MEETEIIGFSRGEYLGVVSYAKVLINPKVEVLWEIRR